MRAYRADGTPLDNYVLEIKCREPVLRDLTRPQLGYVYSSPFTEYEDWYGDSLAGVTNYVHLFHHSFNEHDIIRINLLTDSGDWVQVYPKGRNRR
jgi:hypothetical protein